MVLMRKASLITQRLYNLFLRQKDNTKINILLNHNNYLIYNSIIGNMIKNIEIVLVAIFLLQYVWTANYNLILLSKDNGAACLDGSPAGIYIHEGTGQNKTKYLIYFNGGGFCGGSTLSQTIQSCYSRSKTNLGTTNVYKPQMSFDGSGVLSTKNTQNPTFYDWTKIFVIYCDGACHQGYRQNPIQYKDQKLYFRGSRNVMELFRYLDITYDFYNGNSIVITGVSAGGMAVYQWSNYLYENTKTAKVYSIPDSGFFITNYYSPIVGAKVLSQRIQNLFNLVSSESAIELPGPVRQCLEDPDYDGDFVACFDAGNYGKFLKPPMLIVQSPYDQWCLNYILVVKCLSNSKAPYSLSRCNDTTMAAISQYRTTVIHDIKQMKGNRKDVGSWGPSCVQHGYISYPSLTSTSFRIPTGSGLTLNNVIDIFLSNPESTPWLIQQIEWPNNKGCSGTVNNLRNPLIM